MIVGSINLFETLALGARACFLLCIFTALG